MFLNPKKVLAFAHIAPDMVIADFETRGSFFALEAAKQLQNRGALYCVGSNSDLLKKVSNEAKHQSLETLHVLKGNIEKESGVPLKDGLLDLIIIANIFFSVEEKSSCAKEAFRLLKKGGRVMLIEWSDSHGGIGPHASHVVKKEDAIKLFSDAGFSVLKEVDANHYHYAYIFQKKD